MSEWLIVLAIASLAILFLVYQANKEPTFNPLPAKSVPLKRDMTYQQLRQCDGEHQNESRVYVALKGVIYDVSSSQFYGKGGGYHEFAGHDASVNLAKMAHDAVYLDKYGEVTLDKEESKVLDDWVARFELKYPRIGHIIRQGVQSTDL